MIERVKAGARWIWEHRTKSLGGVGSALTYVYMQQDKLQLVIPAKHYAQAMAVIAGATLAVGFYNTFVARKQAI